ncbi:MAG: acyl-CoA dehydrogenase family protein [Deltaproteobacteria bacterium]|nr:acyl-CoA dehydrogenase family protein [Deltaproteobacteria bacterium]
MVVSPKLATIEGGQTEERTLLPGGGFLLHTACTHPIFTAEQFTEDHRAFYRTATDFIEQEVTPKHKEIEAKTPGLMPQLLRKAGELGFHMIDIPEHFGGLGLDKTTSCLVAEALARQGSFSVALGAHNGIGMLPLVFFGSDALKEAYLPKFATAEMIGAYALTEPGSGSDALAAKTTAKLSDDGQQWIINGSKMWITNANIADVFTVFAKIDGKRFSAFLVPRNTPGFEVGREEPKMGIHGSSTCALSFDNVKIPKENLLGEEGRGHKIAFNILNMGRLRLGVAVMGGSKFVLGLAAKYAKERKQFDRTLAEFPIIQQKLADMAVAIYKAESCAYRTTGNIDAAMSRVAKDDPNRPTRLVEAIEEYNVEASIMKISGSEGLDAIVDEAVQIHGGYGYSEDYAVEVAYRDSRINRIFEGTNEINRMLIPGTILKRAMKGTLDLLPVAQSIQNTLHRARSPIPPLSDGPLAQEAQLAELVRRATVYTMGTAAMKLMTDLEKEQEQLAMLADLCMDAYAIDSVVRRAMQAQATETPARAELHLLFAEVAALQIYEDAMARARRVVVELFPDEDQYTRFMELKRLHLDDTMPVIPLRRRLAKAVIDADGYPLRYL